MLSRLSNTWTGKDPKEEDDIPLRGDAADARAPQPTAQPRPSVLEPVARTSLRGSSAPMPPGSTGMPGRGAGTVRPGDKSTGRYDRNAAYGNAALVLLPWSVYVILVSLFTFAFHRVPVLVYTVLAGSLLGSVIVLVFADKRNPRGGNYYMKLGILCGMGTLCAYLSGMYNYEYNMASYWTYDENQTYTNVMPTEPAAAHTDAGKITFASSARVDSNRVVGYKAGTRYCVAPILDDTQQNEVQFWAAGTNCCLSRKDFFCDDALSPQARSGVVIIESPGFLFPSPHPQYMKAVSEAEAAFGLKSSKTPMFLRWVLNPDETQLEYWKSGFAFFCLASGIYLVISCVLAALPMMTGTRKLTDKPNERTALRAGIP